MKAEGTSFSPVKVVARDTEPNGAPSAQPQLLNVVGRAAIKPELVVSNLDLGRREAGETTPHTWRIVGPEGRSPQMAAHQCLEKPRNAPKSWQASAQKLVAAFVSGSEKEQVFLWSVLLEQGAQVVPFLVA